MQFELQMQFLGACLAFYWRLSMTDASRSILNRNLGNVEIPYEIDDIGKH